MILVDTNIWIEAFRGKEVKTLLSELLLKKQVIVHPWILGEIMMGQLGTQRKKILGEIDLLPRSYVTPVEELLSFIENHHLFGKGLSLIDAELLHTCLQESYTLWTHDKNLRMCSKKLGRNYQQDLV